MRALQVWVVSALLLAAVACATNPATGRRQLILMSEAEEIQLGRQSDEQVRAQMGVYDDPELQRYVDAVGQRLARASHRPDLPWTFTVVDEQAVNAFALPGGFVYLTRGILPFLRNEAEMAAVLGHEVGHVDARHSVEAYSRQTLAGGSLALAGVLFPETQPFQGLAGLGFGLLFLSHSREAELESDQLGVEYTAANGWDPGGMPGLLGTLDRLDAASGSSRGVPNWALTHPRAADRVDQVQAAVAAARTASTTTTNEAEFERRLDGLVFGDSREKGIVRGQDFLHPVMRFALRFPEGWGIINSDQQVLALRDENSGVGLVLQLSPESNGSVEQIADRNMTNAGYRQVSGDTERINGLSAYVGTYDGTMNQTAVRLLAAHIASAGRTYVLAGVAPVNAFAGVRDVFARAIESFRELSQREADQIQPDRLDFYTVRSGDTWTSIASGPGDGIVSASTLAIMNGFEPDQGPRAGDRIRIIVGG